MTPTEPEVNSSLEEKKLALEEKKVEIEFDKLRVERLKGWTTGGSIVISLLIAALTLAFGIWSQHKQVMTQIALQDKQAQSQLDLQERNSKSQFEIKAAEIVMNTETPGVTRNKAKALLALFPKALPENFAQSFEPSRYIEKRPTSNSKNTQPRIVFLNRPGFDPYRWGALPNLNDRPRPSPRPLLFPTPKPTPPE